MSRPLGGLGIQDAIQFTLWRQTKAHLHITGGIFVINSGSGTNAEVGHQAVIRFHLGFASLRGCMYRHDASTSEGLKVLDVRAVRSVRAKDC